MKYKTKDIKKLGRAYGKRAFKLTEKMIEEFNINIQYVSQEERRKKMNEMYGINSIKQ